MAQQGGRPGLQTFGPLERLGLDPAPDAGTPPKGPHAAGLAHPHQGEAGPAAATATGGSRPSSVRSGCG